MTVYRYYCKLRPPMPGGIPRDGLVRTASFDYPQTFNGVGGWGWAEYSRPLTEKEIADHELAASLNNPLTYEGR